MSSFHIPTSGPLHCKASQKKLRAWRKALRERYYPMTWPRIIAEGHAVNQPLGRHRDRSQG